MTTTHSPSSEGARTRPEALPRQPKPEWLKVRAPGSENYRRLKGLMRDLGPAHGVRGSELPEHRRVLEPRHRDVHDPRRHLHAFMRLLQRRARHAAGRRIPPNRSTSPARSTRWRWTTWSSPRSIVTTCRTAAQRTSHGPSPRPAHACPQCRIEVLIPDFKGDEARTADRARRAARTSSTTTSKPSRACTAPRDPGAATSARCSSSTARAPSHPRFPPSRA